MRKINIEMIKDKLMEGTVNRQNILSLLESVQENKKPVTAYHVTFSSNLNSIRTSGLKNIDKSNFYTMHENSRKGIFFSTCEDDVSYWFSKFEELAQADSDDFIADNKVPVVLRFTTKSYEVDELARREDHRNCSYYTTENAPNTNIEFYFEKWLPINSFNIKMINRAVDDDGYFLNDVVNPFYPFNKTYMESVQGSSSLTDKITKEIPDTILINGVQRSTRNEKGSLISSKIEYIENFWKWFGNSQTVDEQSRPLVYMHGTATPGISEFAGNRSYAGHFTQDSSFAEDFSNSRASEEEENGSEGYAQTYMVYLKALNIFDVRNPEHFSKLPKNSIRDTGARDFSFLEVNAKYIKYAGFDAVRDYENESYGDSTGLAVFSPNQIKSATGNNGSFSNSNDILTESITIKIIENDD